MGLCEYILGRCESLRQYFGSVWVTTIIFWLGLGHYDDILAWFGSVIPLYKFRQ